jgi:hypothetical protein
MKNKTCGECRYYNEDFNLCLHWRYEDITESSGICNYFAPLTNGDVIRQMSNAELAEIINNVDCKKCPAYMTCFDGKKKTCFDGFVAWLNAPAESEGENE